MEKESDLGQFFGSYQEMIGRLGAIEAVCHKLVVRQFPTEKERAKFMQPLHDIQYVPKEGDPPDPSPAMTQFFIGLRDSLRRIEGTLPLFGDDNPNDAGLQ